MSGMANYVSLDEAAKILGITTDELVDMRSRGEIFGYRDGASWKFKQEEIERVQSELDGDALNEDAGGSSILISGKPADGDEDDEIAISSDLKLATEGSDVALVADPESGSGVKLVKRNKQDAGNSDLKLESEAEGSDIALGSDLKLTDDASASGMDLLGRQPDSNVLGSDLGIKSGTGSNAGTPSVGSGSLDLGGDLELAKDDEDDLVLGSDSAVGLGSESGINLMSPSDSGLSLEDEPLDLAGTGISGLDLGAEMAAESASGSKVGSASGIGGLGSGALVDFQQGEEFQLTPSGGIEGDDDSGSQVIELEDSGSFGAGAGLPDADLGSDGIVQEAGLDGGLDEMSELGTGAGAAVAMRGAAETPYTGFQVGMLSLILLLMGLCGILTSDILRNLWAWDGQTDYSTGLTSMLVKALGGS
jgi:excisionase family DNA binding protein